MVRRNNLGKKLFWIRKTIFQKNLLIICRYLLIYTLSFLYKINVKYFTILIYIVFLDIYNLLILYIFINLYSFWSTGYKLSLLCIFDVLHYEF